MSKISLEKLLTSALFFKLTSATPVQRAKCRILAGEPLRELASDLNTLEAIGGEQALALLPKQRPLEFLDISAIRIGKSLFAAALIVWLSQTVDLKGVRRSDIVRIFVVALNLRNTAAVMAHLVESMLDSPALRLLLADDPKELTVGSAIRNGLHLKHPSGHIIEVQAVPLDRAGGSGVSVFCAGVVVDEYPRMVGAEDGVKNIEHFRQAVIGRLLPGALYFATGSPWQPYGPAYDNTLKHFGKPTEDLVVMRTNARPFVGLAPGWPNWKYVERLQRTEPLTYKTDFLAEFSDGEQAVFPAQAIEDAWQDRELGDAEYGRPAIFADPSALRHDYWAACVAGWVHPVLTLEDEYEIEELGPTVTESKRVCHCQRLGGAPHPAHGQVIPGRNGYVRILEDEFGRLIRRRDGKQPRPLLKIYEMVSWDKNSGARGMDLVRAVGDLGRLYGCLDFHWDGYEQLMLGDLIRNEGFRPQVHTWSQGRKTEAVDHLRTLFVERRVLLPKHDVLKQELVRFVRRATPGGNFQYIVSGGGGHGDHASCLTLASLADLDGFVDRSPTTHKGALKHEVLDHHERDEDDDEYE